MRETHVGYVSDELYLKITDSVPIVCVDLVPYDAQSKKIGVITRATGSQAGKLALIGGRVKKNESIDQAIQRHLSTDLDITDFSFYKNNSVIRPFYVQQYYHGEYPGKGFAAFDPTKHAIALSYIIIISGNPIAKLEASEFHWIDASELPKSSAFNHAIIMKEALAFTALCDANQ